MALAADTNGNAITFCLEATEAMRSLFPPCRAAFVTASLAALLVGQPVYGLRTSNRGGGGGEGKHSHPIVLSVRAQVNSGLKALIDHEKIPMTTGRVRHLRLPAGARTPYVDAFTPSSDRSTLSHTASPNVTTHLHKLFAGAIKEIRSSMVHADLRLNALANPQDTAPQVLFGAKITRQKPSNTREQHSDIYQEGFCLLVHPESKRHIRMEQGELVLPVTIGMRVWAALPQGIETQLYEQPFRAIGLDIVAEHHFPHEILRARLTPDDKPNNQGKPTEYRLFGLGTVAQPEVIPWVADGIPAFNYNQQL